MYHWLPTASIENLKHRAVILKKIRDFFATRNVLEVDTPLLGTTTASDPHITSIRVDDRYLQTSPEFAMKRLLSAGSGSIYQICKAFRDDEVGRLHNPEFTILEWYRPGFNHLDLMQEMDELLQIILNTKPADKFSYQELFAQFLKINPHHASFTELKQCAEKNGVQYAESIHDDKDDWLHLLMTHCIEPNIGKEKPVFIYDYPASQAALAQIRPGNPTVAERFEVYFHGVELANGYHELADSKEQRQRFLADNKKRAQLGFDTVPVDEKLLAALAHGFPECAGVALGVDRLIMLAMQAESISNILSFNWQNS